VKCPHCQVDLKYRERSSGRCPHCRQPFALEPRANPLGLGDVGLRKLAERLSQQGAYRYTAAQLAHFAILRKLKPLVKQGRFQEVNVEDSIFKNLWRVVWLVAGVWLGCLMLAWLVVVVLPLPPLRELLKFLAIVVTVIAVFIIMIILGVSGNISQSISRQRNRIRNILHAPDTFEQTYIAPWERVHGPLPGRVSREELASLRQYQPPPSRVRAVLASPDPEALDCARANGLPERLGLALLRVGGPYSEAEEQVLELLRKRPRLPVLLLHDASLEGAQLRLLLPGLWKLAADQRIIDLGLRPAQVQRWCWPWQQDKPVAQPSLTLPQQQAQLAGTLTLTEEELKWLREGRVTSVRFIPPAALVRTVTTAVERLAPVRVRARAVDRERQARMRAQMIGFMSWPES